MFKRAAVLVVSCGALLAGCDTDVQTGNQELISNLLEAGIPADSIVVVDDAVYMGRDTQVSLDASRELLQRGPGSAEHFRSANLVSTSVTKICVNPSSTLSTYPVLSQGLNLAIANYNALGLRIYFVRGPATGCTANISVQTQSGSSYLSGLPANGLPYPRITVGTLLNDNSLEVCQAVFTHTMGHAIGLYHTDAYDPSISCGPNYGGVRDYQNDSPVGGILVGTYTATQNGSIWNTCIPGATAGEFTSSDRSVLNYLY